MAVQGVYLNMASKPKRPYRKRKRARSEEETRRRITEAAVELHGSVGPANTTVTEVAERAGVSRMTVYNHFPSDSDLFEACSAHWASRNPFPDPTTWLEHTDPIERLEIGLLELYGWYARNQAMLGKVLRDADAVPSLRELMDGFWGSFIDGVVSTLLGGWHVGPDVGEGLPAAVRLVVDFQTWRVLSEAGLADSAAAKLAARMVQGVVDRASA